MATSECWKLRKRVLIFAPFHCQEWTKPWISPANRERVAAAEWLLSNGFSIERTLGESETPLIQAVKAGKREMTKWLLKKGANRGNAKDTQGKTALDWSRENGQADLEKLLNG